MILTYYKTDTGVTIRNVITEMSHIRIGLQYIEFWVKNKLRERRSLKKLAVEMTLNEFSDLAEELGAMQDQDDINGFQDRLDDTQPT